MRAMMDKVAARGVADTAQRVANACELVFRYAVSRGLAEKDATVGLRDTLPKTKKKHHAAITEPLALGAPCFAPCTPTAAIPAPWWL